MKKFIMTFLVAGLMITSALSLSSCKKTVTDANQEEWIPIVYDIVSPDGSQSISRDGVITMQCYYCTNPLYQCTDTIEFVDHCLYCPTHSHKHCFEANDNCDYTNQVRPCRYKGVRKHFHIITSHIDYDFHGWHVGGGCGGMD